MFELFNEAIAKPLQCGLELVIDETLYSCRGRFPFKQYMPQKPGKYGCLYKASKLFVMLCLVIQACRSVFIFCGSGSSLESQCGSESESRSRGKSFKVGFILLLPKEDVRP